MSNGTDEVFLCKKLASYGLMPWVHRREALLSCDLPDVVNVIGGYQKVPDPLVIESHSTLALEGFAVAIPEKIFTPPASNPSTLRSVSEGSDLPRDPQLGDVFGPRCARKCGQLGQIHVCRER